MAIENQTILITGGTSGIGRGLALELSKGNRVIVTGRNKERLVRAESEGMVAMYCDLNDKASIEHLVLEIEQSYPGLNTLINNAGIQYNYDLLAEPNLFEKIHIEISTNLVGAIQLTHLLLPILSTKTSTILNVTSGLATVPKSDGLIYSASKAGLHNFTLGLRKVLKHHPIRVIEVIPLVTATPMTSTRTEQKMEVEELVQLVLKQWRNGRLCIAPTQIKLLLWINRFFPTLANLIVK